MSRSGYSIEYKSARDLQKSVGIDRCSDLRLGKRLEAENRLQLMPLDCVVLLMQGARALQNNRSAATGQSAGVLVFSWNDDEQ